MPESTIAEGSVAAEIETDLPCAACGYNLKGLAPEGTCPECGRPVARTITGELQLSDPQWLKSQARNLFALGAISFIWVNYQAHSAFRYIGFWHILNVLPNLLAISLTLYGAFVLSRYEASDWTAQNNYDARRRGLRVACVAYALYIAWTYTPWSEGNALMPAAVVGSAALVIVHWLTALLLRDFALRAPGGSLRLHADIVLWAMPLYPILTIALTLLITGIRMEFGELLLGLTRMLIGIAGLFVTIVYLTLLGRLHETLVSAANTAHPAEKSDPRN